jgi:predicted DNA-binding protein with PD1-like motif
MRSAELTIGRTFGVVFEPGEDFFPTLSEFCKVNDVQQGYIPMFLAAFAEVEIVGACDKLENPDAPVWSKVHLTNVEAVGGGTIAYDANRHEIMPHVHTTIGEKARSATAYTSHLLAARVQFLVEMILVEVTSPEMTRRTSQDMFNVPILRFTANAQDLNLD